MRTSVLIPQLADGAARHHRLVAAFFAAVLLVASPSRAEVPPGCNPPPSAQALDTAPPINLGELKLQLVRYRCTRYDADVAKVLRQARTYLEHEAARVKKPALVLDIDETSLSNWKQIYQNDFGYIAKGDCDFSKGTACAQNAWEQSAGAEPIVPTRDLFKAARARQVTVFFITGRAENSAERSATEANLHKAGYDGWQQIYMRTEKFAGSSVAPFKTWARSDIEAQGYTIIANVGDQKSDLANGHARRTFKVPNPFYYIR